jgi:hypothetical protein
VKVLGRILGIVTLVALAVPELSPAAPQGGPQKGQGPMRRGGRGAMNGGRVGGGRIPKGLAGRPLGPQGAPRGTRAAMGNSFLRAGSARAAVSSFRKQLESDPTSPALHVGLGRALAKIGSCEEALAELWPNVGTSPFGAEAAFSAATCSSRLGFIEDAVFFDHIAVELDPTNARALTNLALDLDTLGDDAGVEETIDELSVVKVGRDASFYVRCVLALRRGDLDEFDTLAALWDRWSPGNRDLLILRGISWLDVDDPLTSFRTLEPIKTFHGSKQLRLTRTEAVRRMGFSEESENYVENRPGSVLEGIDADAVRARVMVDNGDVGAARALLSGYGDVPDADFIASQWYVARAEGNAAAMAEAADRYAEVSHNRLRKPELLVPVDRR